MKMNGSNRQDINMKQRVLLAGATGLVGRNILHLLSKDNRIEEVRALIRHPLPAPDNSPLVQELITDFDRLQEHPEWFEVDIVFCALGTTIAKARTRKHSGEWTSIIPLQLPSLLVHRVPVNSYW